MEFKISGPLPAVLPRSVSDILKKGRDITLVKKLSMKAACSLSLQEKQSEHTYAGVLGVGGPRGQGTDGAPPLGVSGGKSL